MCRDIWLRMGVFIERSVYLSHFIYEIQNFSANVNLLFGVKRPVPSRRKGYSIKIMFSRKRESLIRLYYISTDKKINDFDIAIINQK